MSDLLSEVESDQQVIKSLLKHIRKLEGNMGRLLFDENGTIYLAHQFEAISKEEINEKIQQNIDEINLVNRVVTMASKLVPTPTDAVESEIVAPEVAPVEAPVEPVVEQAPVEPVPQPEVVEPTPIVLQ